MMSRLVCPIVLVLALIFIVEGSFMRSREDAFKRESACKDTVYGCHIFNTRGYCNKNNSLYQYVSTVCPVTCGLCKATPTVPPVAQPIPVNPVECLAAHNAKRQLHGSPPLTWDTELAQGAQAWSVEQANNFSDPRDIDHSDANGAYGENMKYFISLTQGATNWTAIVNDWYSEIDQYNWNNPGTSTNGKDIGHFTQVVWKSTTKVGCGVAKIQKGFITHYVVFCRYTPPGNYPSGYAMNVKPKQ